MAGSGGSASGGGRELMAPWQTKQELREIARRMVESSCREQGLEVEITDPVVIGKIAAIFRASDSPLGRNPTRIKPVETSNRT